ncbi:DUF6612 family protein [Anaerosinus massiliensis]|uniref:DUF6612 family protein n=1 Tax=Massilibacillus massiliensis TaxID=1806837 RepID=UPI000DA63AFC|nr:DUF6612 family protein [Massilibacillus massiliensis]
MRKIFFYMLFAVLLSMTSFTNAAFAAEQPGQEAEAMEYMQSVYENMAKLKNYHTEIAIDVQTSLMNMAVNNSSDIELQPMRYKNESQFVMTDPEKRTMKTSMTQYMEEVDRQLITYTEVEGKYIKQVLPYITERAVSPYDMTAYMKVVKKAVVLSETDTDKEVSLTLDADVLREMTENILLQSGPDAKNYLNFVETIFKDFPDMTYTVHIDKKTKRVSQVNMDLSEIMQRSILAINEKANIPEKDKAQLKTIFGSMKVLVQCQYSKFDQVKPIQIPKEVKEKAVEQKADAPIVSAKI